MANFSSQDLQPSERKMWEPSFSLQESAKNHLDFLQLVYNHTHLHNKAVLLNAIRRYESCWLPILSSEHTEPLEPPLDVHWIWHAHMLSPLDYIKDCKNILEFVPSHTLRSHTSEDYKLALDNTEKIWTKMFPTEPFQPDFNRHLMQGNTHNVEPNDGAKQCMYDLLSATQRQAKFFYQVSLPHFKDSKFLDTAVRRYKNFLYLKKEQHNLFIVPMYDIDLIWHTHQLSPQNYASDMCEVLGYILPHDDKDQDRAVTSKLTQSAKKTKVLYYDKYKSLYAVNGTCYRGDSLRGCISQDSISQPLAMTYFITIEKVLVSKWEGVAAAFGKICETKGNTLLELPRAEDKTIGVLKFSANRDNFIWEPASEIEVTTTGLERACVLEIFLSKCTGWLDFFDSSSPMKIAVSMDISGRQSRTLSTSIPGVTTEIYFSVKESKAREASLNINWGSFCQISLQGAPPEDWGALNIPDPMPPPPLSCDVASHRIMASSIVLYEVRVINIAKAGLSFVQVFQGDKLVATSEAMSPYQTPGPKQVGNLSSCVTMDLEIGERAMLIKNSQGDWGVVKGHRNSAEGLSRFSLGTPVVASLTILSPLRVGKFTLYETSSLGHTLNSWTGMFQNNSRIDLFGKEGISVKIAEGIITVGSECCHLAEFLAVIFSLWVD